MRWLEVLFRQLLLVGLLSAANGSSSSSRPNSGSSSSSRGNNGAVAQGTQDHPESLLKSFLRARCGPSGAGVWVYQGSLIDPLNGNEIAQVQGVELVRCLAVTDASSAQRERFQRRCSDLACAEAIGSGGGGGGVVMDGL